MSNDMYTFMCPFQRMNILAKFQSKKNSDKAFRLLQFIFGLLTDSYGIYNISPNIGHFPEVHVEY